jgi:hypothetical protein
VPLSLSKERKPVERIGLQQRSFWTLQAPDAAVARAAAGAASPCRVEARLPSPGL